MAGKTTKKSAAKKTSAEAPKRRDASKKGSTINKMSQIRERAQELAIKVPVGINKTELVRCIQRKEGNFDCFGTASDYCDQVNCLFRRDCLR